MSNKFENKKITVCWISAGVSSFIAGYLERDNIDKFIYIDIEDQHEDSMRFIKDSEILLGKEIEILKPDFGSVENCIRCAGIIKHPVSGYAPCTNWMKKITRESWERDNSEYDITYVWGFDMEENDRAQRIREVMFEFNHKFPLIDNNLTKQDCHAMAYRLGIKRPVMYDMGYQNNNCIGCIKGGMGYWNKIRVDFPGVFASREKLERDIGASILKESDGTPLFLDELNPNRGRFEDEISQDCGVFCYLIVGDGNG